MCPTVRSIGEGSADLQVEARYLLQAWPGQYPGLPMVFLGDALQKYAILAARPALVPFVTTPFSPHDLMQAMQPLLPKSCPSSPMSPVTRDAQASGWMAASCTGYHQRCRFLMARDDVILIGEPGDPCHDEE